MRTSTTAFLPRGGFGEHWKKYNATDLITYIWDKYNRVSTTRYYWNRNNVVSTTNCKWEKYAVEAYYANAVSNVSGSFSVEKQGSDTSNTSFGTNSSGPTLNSNTYISNGKYYTSTWIYPGNAKNHWCANGNGVTAIYWVTSTTADDDSHILTYTKKSVPTKLNKKGAFVDYVEALAGTYPDNGVKGSYWYVLVDSTTTYSKGTTSYSQVSSTNRSAYPDNNYSGSYWYTYSKSGTTYSKGSTNYGEVSSTTSNAYPNNSYSGSYWYVYDRSETSKIQGTFMENVVHYKSDAFPTNGLHTDGYWYVKDT